MSTCAAAPTTCPSPSSLAWRTRAQRPPGRLHRVFRRAPILSGALEVSGFGLYNSSRTSTAPRAGRHAGRQLFVNGARALRARGPLNPTGLHAFGSSFITSDSSYASFTNASSIEVVDNNDWKQMRCPLASITAPAGGGSSLNVNPACFADNNTSVPNLGLPVQRRRTAHAERRHLARKRLPAADQPRAVLPRQRRQLPVLHPAAGREPVHRGCRTARRCRALLTSAAPPGTWRRSTTRTRPSTYTRFRLATSSDRSLGDLSTTTCTRPRSTATRSATRSPAPASTCSSRPTATRAASTSTSTAPRCKSVSAYAPARRRATALVSVTGLSKAQHTVKLVKTGGTTCCWTASSSSRARSRRARHHLSTA